MSLRDCNENDIISDIFKQDIVDDFDAWFETVSGISVLHLNVRSIYKHWNQLKAALQLQIGKFDILILTEIGVQTVDEYYSLDGYNSFSKTRSRQRGGGILIFIKENINFEIKASASCHFENICGILTVENSIKIFLLAVYRPPSNSKSEFINELKEICNKIKFKNAILIGDVNLNLLDPDDISVHAYEDVLAVNGFFKCINGATREEHLGDKFVSSCIDHIFIRSSAKHVNSVIYKTKISDHYLVACALNFKSTLQLNENVTGFSMRLDETKLHYELKMIDWSTLMHIDDPADMYDAIVNKFSDCYDKSSYRCYSLSNKCKPKKDWMTTDLLLLIKRRDKLFSKWKNCTFSHRSALKDDYKKYRQYVSSQINKAKVEYYKNELNKAKNSLKDTWQTINTIIGKKKKASVDEVISKHFGSRYPNDYISNKFADTFIDEVSQINHECDITTLPQKSEREANQSMYMQSVSPEFVKNVILSMDQCKQPGIDKIRVKDLHLLAKPISVILAKLINLCIKTGVMPAKLKVSKIRPVYKKGDHTKFGNYRPIAIMSFIEKIIERCIAIKLTEYLEQFKIINPLQFGFQKGKSTANLLASFSDYVNAKLNAFNHVLVLFIDFSKAFDTLSHKKLLIALEKNGIRGPLLRWFESYLSNRHITVQIGNTLSGSQLVSSGVPQGSILGPILYLLYVNELADNVLNCQSFLYADDTAIISSHKDVNIAAENLQNAFSNILKLTHDKNLVINSEKTKIVHIRSPSIKLKSLDIDIICHSFNCLHNMSHGWDCMGCTSTIQYVPNHVYLGVTIDNNFSWKPHIDVLCRKLRSCAFRMFTLKQILPSSLLRVVYFALVESQIAYGILTWGNASYIHVHHLISLQTKIIKCMMPGGMMMQIHDDTNTLYNLLKILPFTRLYQYKFILEHYFENKFKIPNDHCFNTRLRSTNRYKVLPFNNKFGKRRLEYSVPVIFNTIPSDLRTLHTYSSMKHEIKNWLINMND
jgi:Reverse transcriptase (RNA-dependent DNA polymerase)